MRVNFDEALKDDATLPPGIYHAEVRKAEEGRSKTSGEDMLTVHLAAIDYRKKPLTIDYLMISGKARGMGTKKLLILGVPKQTGEFDLRPSDLVGKRAYVRVVVDEYKGKKSLKITNEDSEGSMFGYWPDDSPPAAYTKPDDEGDPLLDDEPDGTPF